MRSVPGGFVDRDGHRAEGILQVRLKWVSVNLWSVLKVSVVMGLGAGVLVGVFTFLVWVRVADAGFFDGLDSALAGFGRDSSSGSVSSWGDVGHTAWVAAVVGLVTLAGWTVVGVVGAIVYNIAVVCGGGILIGFSSDSAATGTSDG